jgi:predicted AlkP superfamily pyrophosphatase or phosphodiesterase
VRRADKSSDALIRAASLSYVSGRSGDLILAAKPGWMFSTTGTTHGSATDDDQRVPLLLMGHGIKPGTYLQRVTPADIAPTLATLAGTSLPRAEGHPLPCLK